MELNAALYNTSHVGTLFSSEDESGLVKMTVAGAAMYIVQTSIIYEGRLVMLLVCKSQNLSRCARIVIVDNHFFLYLGQLHKPEQ
jgi:hypothetical protein